MKQPLRIAAFLLLSSLAFASSSVTGTVTDPGTGFLTGNNYVLFELQGCGNNPAHATQPGEQATLTLSKRFTISASGTISGAIVRNDQISCGGVTTSTFYLVTLYLNNSPVPGTAQKYRITAATFVLDTATPITVNPVVTAPTGDSTYIRKDGGNSPSTGPVTTVQLNNAIYLDQIATCNGTTDDAVAIQTAITAAANKTLVLPAGKTCATGSQLTISSPTNVLLYGTLKAITTGTPVPLIMVSSSNVKFDCANSGGINGNSKAWGGIRFYSAGAFLSGNAVENCSFTAVARGGIDVEVIGSFSGKGTIIRGNSITSSGIIGATTGGSFGIYTQYCQGCIVESNYLDTVGSTGINTSAGVGNHVSKNYLLKATLYAVKGGYGLPGTVSGDVAASTTSFTVTKNTLTSQTYAPGQFVTIVHSASTTCDGYVKTVTDNTTYLTIATSTMGCTPSTGDVVEMPDTGTLIEGNDITWTSADAMDFNISKDITIKNNRIKYAGLYAGAGGALNAINSCIWVGADAQSISPYGTIHPFKSDSLTIEGNTCAHAGGSGIGIFESDNVSIRGNVITLIDEGGFDATTATDPAYGCVEQGRQGFVRHNQISIENNTCTTSVGYSVIANFGRNTTIAGNTGKSPFGMKVDAQIVANVVGNTMEVTAANAFGLRLGDPSGANASSGITLSGNFISCDVVSCTALKQTDAGASGIRDCGANMWEYNGSAQAPVVAVTLGTCSPYSLSVSKIAINGGTGITAQSGTGATICMITGCALVTPSIGGETITFPAHPAQSFFARTVAVNTANQVIGQWVPDKAITVTRLTGWAFTASAACSAATTFLITDGSTAVSTTLANAAQSIDSGAVTQAYAAGTTLQVKVSTSTLCAPVPTDVNISVQWKLQ